MTERLWVGGGERSRARRGFYLLISCLILCVLTAAAWGQPTTALVTGVDRLVVRRGPGKRYAVFAVLSRGAKVEVHQIKGEWARIVTAAGQRGYVNGNFLALPGDREHVAADAAAPPANHAAAAPEVIEAQPTELHGVTERLRAAEADLRTANERNKTLETELRTAGERTKSLDVEVHDLQGQVSDLKNRPEPAPGANAGAAASATLQHLQAELTRLTSAVEAIQHRLDASPATESSSSVGGLAEETQPLVSAAPVLLGMVGILVGWFLGGTLGRKQDRGRRSRIRF